MTYFGLSLNIFVCTDSPHVPIQTSTVSPRSLPFAWILLLKEIWAILAVKARTKLHLGMAPTPRKKHAICNIISCNTIVKWLALPHYNYKHDLFGRSSNIDGVLAQQKRWWFCDKALLPNKNLSAFTPFITSGPRLSLGYWIEKNGKKWVVQNQWELQWECVLMCLDLNWGPSPAAGMSHLPLTGDGFGQLLTTLCRTRHTLAIRRVHKPNLRCVIKHQAGIK